jgi:hypothetical protein
VACADAGSGRLARGGSRSRRLPPDLPPKMIFLEELAARVVWEALGRKDPKTPLLRPANANRRGCPERQKRVTDPARSRMLRPWPPLPLRDGVKRGRVLGGELGQPS